MLGDGIRRNIATVSKEERDRFRDAIVALDAKLFPGAKTDPIPGGVSYWFKQDETHDATHVHFCPAFLPWHRELMNRFEAMLREESVSKYCHASAASERPKSGPVSPALRRKPGREKPRRFLCHAAFVQVSNCNFTTLGIRKHPWPHVTCT